MSGTIAVLQTRGVKVGPTCRISDPAPHCPNPHDLVREAVLSVQVFEAGSWPVLSEPLETLDREDG